MRHHQLGRSPAGRGSHLKRLNAAGPDDLTPAEALTNVASDPIFLEGPITITVLRSPSLTTANMARLTSWPSSIILSPSQSSVTSAIPTDAPLSSPSPTSSVANADETDTAAGTQATTSEALNSSRRTPAGTIAAIVVIVSLFLIAFGFFVVRKWSIRKRIRKRATWNARYMGGPVSSADYVVRDSNNVEGNPANPEKPRRVPVPSVTPSMISSATERPAESIPPIPPLPPPPISYNNDNQTYPLSAVSSANPFLPSNQPSRYAAVQYTFIPSLPDELTISIGEMLRIVAEYDDGWALCMSGMGDEGMVPLECLVYPKSKDPLVEQRASKRISSLSAKY